MSDGEITRDGIGAPGGAGDGSPGTEGPSQTASELDLFLDGQMAPAQAAAFARRMVDDPVLRAQIELQGRIDGRLRATMVPPARLEITGAMVGSVTVLAESEHREAPAMAERGSAAADAPMHAEESAENGAGVVGRVGPVNAVASRRGKGAAGAGLGRWRWAAMAAAVLLVAGAGSYWWFVIGGTAPYRWPAEIYQNQVVRGYEPQWACTTDAEFEQAVRTRFDEPALLPLATAGVQIVGWAYGTPVLSNKTAALLTRVEGREVIVLIDRAERDANLRRAGSAAGYEHLNLFKRRLGGLVLYEVTPLDSARVIPAFVAGS